MSCGGRRLSEPIADKGHAFEGIAGKMTFIYINWCHGALLTVCELSSPKWISEACHRKFAKYERFKENYSYLILYFLPFPFQLRPFCSHIIAVSCRVVYVRINQSVIMFLSFVSVRSVLF